MGSFKHSLGLWGCNQSWTRDSLVGDNSEFEFFSTFEGVLPSLGECWGQKLVDCPWFPLNPHRIFTIHIDTVSSIPSPKTNNTNSPQLCVLQSMNWMGEMSIEPVKTPTTHQMSTHPPSPPRSWGVFLGGLRIPDLAISNHLQLIGNNSILRTVLSVLTLHQCGFLLS